MYKKSKRIIVYFVLFLMLISLFYACKQNDDTSVDTQIYSDIDSIENVISYKQKGFGEYVLYPKTDSCSILFANGNKVEFEDITDKITKKSNGNTFILIPQKPFLIITYDDTPASDYDIYQIHKLYTPIIPAEFGVILQGHALTNEKIVEMVTEGNWEIVHHSYSHTRFQYIHLPYDNSATDKNKVYGWFAHTFINGNEITLGDDCYTIVSHSSDSKGQYFTVTPDFVNDYPRTTTLQISDEQLIKEVTEGIEEFKNATGIEIKHFTWPYTVYDDRTVEMISRNFASARAYNGSVSGSKNLDDPGMNYFPFENRYTLNSADFVINYTEDEILTAIAKAKETNAMIIQYFYF